MFWNRVVARRSSSSASFLSRSPFLRAAETASCSNSRHPELPRRGVWMAASSSVQSLSSAPLGRGNGVTAIDFGGLRRVSSGVAADREGREARARRVWREADCVCFDVDSTVSTEEGIDVLAKACGKEEEVAEWTRRAMGGNVLFQDAIKARLSLMTPPSAVVDQLLKSHDFPITPGIPELVRILQERQTDIFFISGGIKQLILPIADRLEVPQENIFAIELFWDAEGRFLGFDDGAPTSASGGKKKVLQHLRSQYKNLVMIGDGATDLEAVGTADAMIGFGANVVRPVVKEGADWFVDDAETLIAELQKAQSSDQQR